MTTKPKPKRSRLFYALRRWIRVNIELDDLEALAGAVAEKPTARKD